VGQAKLKKKSLNKLLVKLNVKLNICFTNALRSSFKAFNAFSCDLLSTGTTFGLLFEIDRKKIN